MKCGYFARQGAAVLQIVCNNNKRWYQRELHGDGFTEWQGIDAPVIINDCLQQGDGMVALKRLRVEPFNVPQR